MAIKVKVKPIEQARPQPPQHRWSIEFPQYCLTCKFSREQYELLKQKAGVTVKCELAAAAPAPELTPPFCTQCGKPFTADDIMCEGCRRMVGQSWAKEHGGVLITHAVAAPEPAAQQESEFQTARFVAYLEENYGDGSTGEILIKPNALTAEITRARQAEPAPTPSRANWLEVADALIDAGWVPKSGREVVAGLIAFMLTPNSEIKSAQGTLQK